MTTLSTLIRMYPREWRQRYGSEMRELLEGKKLSMRTVADLIAGALDARLNPQIASARQTSPSEGAMNMSQVFRCSSHGISTPDQLRSAAWLLGGTIILTTLGLVLRTVAGPNSLSESLLYSAFFGSLMLSTQSMYLKCYSATARRIMGIGGALLIVLIMWGAVALANLL